MARAYAVVEISYVYNDSYHEEQDGGWPIKIFKNEQDAEKYADQLMVERLRSLSGELSSYFPFLDPEDKGLEKYLEFEGPWVCYLKEGLSDDELIEFAKRELAGEFASRPFYEVVEVDVED